MIDWGWVAANGVWLVGLALLLAAFSFHSYTGTLERLVWRTAWARFSSSDWSRLGALPFCAGMGLTAGSWPERALWTLLCLYILCEWVYAWRRGRRGRHESISRSGETRPQAQPQAEAQVAARVETETQAQIKEAAEDKRWLAAIRQSAEWVVRLELAWLLLLAPIFLFPSPGSPFLLALAALPLIWVARRVARGRFVPRTPLDWAVCLLLVMVLVNLYVSFDLRYSLPRTTALLYSVGLFYALVEWSTTRAKARRALGGYALLGMAFALLGLLGVNWVTLLGVGWGEQLFPPLGQLRAQIPTLLRGLPDTSRWLHPNEVGGALLWVVPVQMALLGWSWSTQFGGPVSRWVVRFGLLIVTLITMFTLVSTQARGALAGFALGIALMGWLLLRWRLRIAVATVVLAGVVMVILVGPEQLADGLSLNKYIGNGLSIIDSERSLGLRDTIWSRALYSIEDFPFTGIGLDTFRGVMPALYPAEESFNLTTSHPHNQLLGAALELGLPGLVAFLALWMGAATLVVQAWRWARRAGDKWARILSAGIGSALLAYFVYGLTDVVSLGGRPGVLWWALLALLVVVWKGSNRQLDAGYVA